jgi:hypothetical protein
MASTSGPVAGPPFIARIKAGVDRGAAEVQQVGGAQLGQQQLVQLLPDPGLASVLQPPPAGHPGAEA